MKQVRYLAGAVGLAPLAIGLGAPPATASVQASSAGGGKTVSLHQTGVTPDTGCKGTALFSIPASGRVKGHGWYTYANATKVCIGTVVESMHYDTANCKSARVAISNGTKVLWSRTHTNICGTAGGEKHTSFSVHQYFTGQIWLWINSQYGDDAFISFA